MNKFLSLLLSACLLVNTALPSFADIITPVVSDVIEKGITRALSQEAYTQLAGNTVLQSCLEKIPTYTLGLDIPDTIGDIALQFQEKQFEGLSEQILSLADDDATIGLMRNEMVGLFVEGQLSDFQYGQTVSFYQEQLAKANDLFASLSPNETLSSLSRQILDNPQTPLAQAPLGVFADAVALALMGGEKDLPSLMEFYRVFEGTALEEVSSTLVGRYFLRLKNYEGLNNFIKEKNPQGKFWEDLPAYAKANGLDILPSKQTSTPKEVPPEFKQALQKFGPFAELAGDFSPSATRIWVAVGNRRDAFALSPIREEAEKALQAAPTEFSQILFSNMGVPPSPSLSQTAQAVEEASSEQTFMDKVRNIFRRERAEVPLPVSLVSKSGGKRALPVTFKMGSRSFKWNNDDEIIFQEEPRFENGYIVKHSTNGGKPVDMEHFYISISSNDVGTLVRAAQKAGISLELKLEHDPNASLERVKRELYDEVTGEKLPVELDVQLSLALWRREAGQAFSHWLESLGLPGTQSENLLLNAQFFLRKNGEIGLKFEGSDEIVSLPEEYYVRFPKHQLQQFIKLEPFLEKGTQLEFAIYPTMDRVDLVARDASFSNVSMGKVGSIVKGPLGVSDATANALMFAINYVMPGFGSLSTPALKKYGEKNLLVVAMGLSALSTALITASGFYGVVERMTLGLDQKTLFMAGLVGLAGSGIIKQLVGNPLIRSNRGVVVLSPEKGTEGVVEELAQDRPRGFKLIAQRFKEIFLQKPKVSLSTVAGYNKSFIYKNVGTLTFLATACVINYAVKFTTGINLGFDFSVAFPLYSLYSTYVTFKVLGSKLRDAYTAEKLNESRQTVLNMIDTGSETLAKKDLSQQNIRDVARSFKDSLDALAFAHIKIDSSKDKKILYEDFKERVLVAVENKLVQEYKKTPEEAQQIMDRLSSAIKAQENNLGNMWAMLRSPGVPSLLTAMTAACVHEFVLSSAFTGIMKDLIPQGELALFLIASTLYLPMIAGRLAGGDLSNRRMSPASMYIGFSALSAIGTAMMVTAGGSVPQTIAGATIATIGIGNFFTQMYDYITKRYEEKRDRELSSLMALTMGAAGLIAIPAGYMAGMAGLGVPANLLYASGMLLASLLLTPKMMQGSSLITGIREEAQDFWQKIKKIFRRGDKNDPGEGPLEGGEPLPAE